MINPTDTDIGRRVRWLGHNFGTLRRVAEGKAVVLLEIEPPNPSYLMQTIPFAELHWADNVGVLFEAGDQEPDPKFPKLRRIHHAPPEDIP